MDYLSVSGEISSSGDEYIIHIYEELGGVFVGEASEHTIHCAGEGCRGVGEAEEHYMGLEQAKRCFKGSSPLVLFPDANVIVSPAYVEFGEDCFPLQLFQYSADEG